MYTKTTIVILCVLIITICQAQDNSNISISGAIEADHISYFENQDNKINARNQSLLLINIKPNKRSKFKYYSSVELREDLSDNTRNRVYLREGYCGYGNKTVEVNFGKQIIEWGQSDKIKPLDVINPVDYTDFLDNEKMGVFVMRSTVYTKAGDFEALFIPVFTPTRLPSVNSRWFFNQPYMVSQSMGFTRYSITNKELSIPGENLESCQYAFQYSNSAAGFDLNANYYCGYSHIPEMIVNTSLVNSDSVDLTFYTNYYKQELCGASVSRVVSNYVLRAEGAYYIPNGLINNTDYFRYSLGVDRTFHDIIGYNSLFVLLQWMDEIDKGNAQYSNYAINHLFRQSLMFKIDFSVGMYANIILQGIYNFHSDDYYLQPSVKYNFGEGLNIYGYYDITGGKQGGFYSYYSNNRIQLKMSYDF